MRRLNRFLPAFMALILLVLMLGRIQDRQQFANELPLTGFDICSHYPQKIKKHCNSLIARSHFDLVAANLCLGRAKEIDFDCLVQVSDSRFQSDMLSLCAGQETSYLRLCLMALRNKVYSETERNQCEGENVSPDKVYCLLRTGHHKS